MKSPGRVRYKIELTAAQIGRLYVALDVRTAQTAGMSEMRRRYRDVWRSIERQQLAIDERRRMKL